MKQEWEDIQDILEDSQNELVEQRESVRDLISDLEQQLASSTIELLQVRLHAERSSI